VISFEHLTKEYNHKAVVDDLHFTIEKGEVFGLLGPNGAGKTTTILMLVGLIEPTKGRCVINDMDVVSNPINVKKIIGYMPDDMGFYPNLTADENLEYFARLYGQNSAIYDTLISDSLRKVGLAGVKKKVGEFSKGMIQRLGIAKILLNDPEIVIMDEPTANIDPPGVQVYRHLIMQLHNEGKTIIISSHVLSEIQKICTSIGLLFNGKLRLQAQMVELDNVIRQQTKNVTIIVETVDPISSLEHEKIMNIAFMDNNRKAIINSRSDIRADIGMELNDKKIRIRGLFLQETNLEQLFISNYSN
jgi:ABC-2 type transport system ATP-binding protein